MIIKKMVLGNLKNNTYIAISDNEKNAVIIDPSYEPERIIEYISGLGLTLKAMLITHGHFDHIAAAPMIKKHMDVPVITHEEEAKIMSDPIKNLSTYFIAKQIVAEADTYVKDNEVLDFGDGLTFKAIVVPGHSAKSVCYYNQEDGVVFTGDTLMAGSVGRTDYYHGSSEDLCKAISARLIFLPKETKVYPGHGFETTIGHEKQYNPFLSGQV